VHNGLVTVTPTPMTDVSPTAAASPTTDPASFANEPRLEACGGLEAGVQQVVALDHAWAYRAVMPGIGFVPQLDASADPALLMIYSGLIPAKLDWRTYLDPPPGRSPTTVSTPTPVLTLLPGTKNVITPDAERDPPRTVRPGARSASRRLSTLRVSLPPVVDAR
jgi:hypothetical protein